MFAVTKCKAFTDIVILRQKVYEHFKKHPVLCENFQFWPFSDTSKLKDQDCKDLQSVKTERFWSCFDHEWRRNGASREV